MQPPQDITTPTATKDSTTNVDSQDSEPTKKRKSSTKTRKQQQPKHQMKMESMQVEPVRVAKSTDSEPKLSATRSPGAYRGRCLYQSRKCENERAIKRNGKPHNLCEEHRSKQNQHQRKFDAKKFSRKRRRGSDSEAEIDGHEAKTPVKTRSVKHIKAEKQEPEVTTIQPQVTSVPLEYPQGYTASMSTSSPTVPVFSYPRAVAIPSLPVSAGLQNNQLNVGARRDMYPSGNDVPGRSDKHAGQLPYLHPQGQHIGQVPPGYSQSELVAASILVQPSSTVPTLPATSTVPSGARYYNTEPPPAIQSRGPSVTTPRLLPSLMVPSTSLQRSIGIVRSPVQLLATTSSPPTLSVGNILPPLTSIAPPKSAAPSSRQNE